MNEVISSDGQHVLTVGEWTHHSMPSDVASRIIIEMAWNLDILYLDAQEALALQRAEDGGDLDDADLHILDLVLMEAEKELAMLAPDGWEVGYDDEGSFGLWRALEGSEEPPGLGHLAYSSFDHDEVVW